MHLSTTMLRFTGISTLPLAEPVMHELILHHYPTSPFAEKARLMLGFQAVVRRSVMIPPVMPSRISPR